MTTQGVFMVLLLSMMLYVTVFDVKRIWDRNTSDESAAEKPAEKKSAPSQKEDGLPAPVVVPGAP